MMRRGSFDSENQVSRPAQVSTQLNLFPNGRDEMFARARVSIDDMARWQELGWISYDASVRETLEHHEVMEMVFIRDLARSGLPAAFVSELLADLPKPYAYDPATTAYSFSVGWVEAVIPDLDDLVENHLEEWAQEKQVRNDEERLQDASTILMLALAELRARRKPYNGPKNRDSENG